MSRVLVVMMKDRSTREFDFRDADFLAAERTDFGYKVLRMYCSTVKKTVTKGCFWWKKRQEVSEEKKEEKVVGLFNKDDIFGIYWKETKNDEGSDKGGAAS